VNRWMNCRIILLALCLGLVLAASLPAAAAEQPLVKRDSSSSDGVVLTNAAAQNLNRSFVVRPNQQTSGVYITNTTHYRKEPWPQWQPPVEEDQVAPVYGPTQDNWAASGSYRAGALEAIYITYSPPGTMASRGSTSTQINLSAIIEREARRNNFDPYLIQVLIYHESGYNNYAVSPAGAQGLMQLMPGTGARLGVTDPFNPYQNVAAGVRYLREQMNAFGDINLALAAYNAGPGAVSAYGGIPPFSETINYVRNIMGAYTSGR